MTTSLLNRIEAWLVKDKLKTSRLEGKLLVSLGGNERVIEITCEEHQANRLQLMVILPFDVQEGVSREVASVIAFINPMMELPGFELHELERQVVYRYVLFTTAEGINKELLTGILGLILLALDLFSELLEAVATGKESYIDFLKQIAVASKKLT